MEKSESEGYASGIIRGMDDVSLREDDEDEKEEEQGAVGGINPPSGEQKMDQQMMTERKVEYLVESGLELPKINITGIRKLRNKDIVIITLGSREAKHKVLDKARSLNRTDRWKNVYGTPDMTRKEQEIDYNLRKEFKERRDKGKKLSQERGETGYPGTTTERKAPRTAEVPITRAPSNE